MQQPPSSSLSHYRGRPRRHYHEVSFGHTGDPLEVLAYHVTHTKDATLEPPASVGPRMVKVAMLAAPWNPADAMSVAGRYPSPYRSSNHNNSNNNNNSSNLDKQAVQCARLSCCFVHRKVAGSEGWGRVIALSNSSNNSNSSSHNHGSASSLPRLQVGDYVVPGQPGLGTLRSQLWLPEEALVRLARGRELMEVVGAPAAAPLFQTGGTALRMLQDFGTLEPGDVVWQNAGNSAVGIMASQLAVALGLRPVSLVRRGKRGPEQWADMVAHLMDVGKNALVVTEEDLVEDKSQPPQSSSSTSAASRGIRVVLDAMRQLSDRPPRLALNAVGGTSAGTLLKVLGPGGTMVTYGNMSTQPVTIPSGQLIFGNVTLSGYWQSRWMAQQSTATQRADMMNELVDLVLDGKLTCPPVQVFPLSDFPAAFAFERQQSNEPIRRKIVFDCTEKS